MIDFKGASEKQEFEKIKPGTYEVVLTAEWKEVNGKKTINCKYFIREDVEQEHKTRLVFDTIWESKNKPGEFTPAKIEKILNAIPNARYEFESYDDFIQYVSGMPMRIDVAIEPADPEKPNSKERNIVKYDSWRQTLKPIIAGESPFKDLKTQTELDVDSLPF